MTNSEPSVFIVGYYGFENAGDEAILQAMVEQLRALRPGLGITVASGNPEATSTRYGVRGAPWNDMGAIRSAVEQAALVLVGGGGLFHDYWGVDPDSFLTNRHWGPVYFATPAVLAMLHEKPLMLYAVGVGPLLSEHARRFTRAACDAADLVTVRDSGSKELLESIGVAADKITLTADPAFAFALDGGPAIRSLPPEGVLAQPIAGVSLRHWAIGTYPDFWQREVAAALDAFLETSGGSVLFLPFQTCAGERENDLAVIERVRSSMSAKAATRILPDSSPEALYAAIGACDVILGMRLHSLVFAFLNRRPFVALSYDPKVGEFARSAGVQDFALDITAVDAQSLAGLLKRALGNRPQFDVALDGRRHEFARLARENARLAIKLLETPSAGARMAQSAAPLLARGVRLFVEERAQHAATVAEHAATAAQHAAEHAATVTELQSARNLLADTAAGLSAFRLRFASDLKAYRSQKAWTVMLAIRKAYTLLVGGGWRGKLDFGKWLLRLPFAGLGPLAPHDLAFPDIAENVPAALLTLQSARNVPAITRQQKYDVIVLAIIDFDFRFQRPQQIAAQFARNGHRVFWISPTRFLPPASEKPYHLSLLRDNLWEIHLRGQPPDIYLGRLTTELVASMIASIRQLCADCGISESAVLIQLPFWRQVALRLREEFGCAVVYDCMDEWDTFPNMGTFNIAEERQLVRETDVLVVSGRTLLEKYTAMGLKPVLARNGVDFEFYSRPHPAAGDGDMPNPVIGYFGAIADWMDLDLVRDTALARPQYSFVMVGQVFRDDISKIDLPNVHLLGSKAYAEIPSYLEHFDVCVIPFVLNEVTRATDPVKLYEYLARGKPVVATAMAELDACADLIYIARDAAHYVAQLDQAVQENDPALRKRRIEYAAANTWEQRYATMDAAIRAVFPLVSIIVVTHDSAEFVRPCLRSIACETSYPNYEVIVVDNASTDGTLPELQECAAANPRIRLQALSTNMGFAAANNTGARVAGGEYLILLNIDTMVTSGWIGRLLGHLRRDPQIGVICPVTNFAGNEALIDVAYLSAGEMQAFALEVARRNARRVLDIDVAPLFCAALRKTLWEELGGLDERFEIGMFEDDDFSLRVRKRGLRAVAAEDCFVHHFGQGSFAKLPRSAYDEVFANNQRRFEEKWNTRWKGHQTRPDVKPAWERVRFQPATFCESETRNE
ncbi:MAG: polysaccharide pyruvyl transferase family protein [Bryobacteraceae bacterium]